MYIEGSMITEKYKIVKNREVKVIFLYIKWTLLPGKREKEALCIPRVLLPNI